jgi:Tol biopolymer transport system component
MRRPTRIFFALVLGALTSAGLASQPAGATFPGRNGDIVFSGSGGIYAIHPDGTGRRRLTTDGSDPVASPNGSEIVFTRCCRPGYKTDVYVMNSDGGNIRQVTSSSSNYTPSWAPDGQTIVFSRYWWKGVDVFSIHEDGSHLTRLTQTPTKVENTPSISPNGDALVFSRFPSGASQDYTEEIFVKQPGDGRPARLTNNRVRDYEPSWSPDGTKIAFVSVQPGKPGDPSSEQIFTMNADGADLQQLTFTVVQEFTPKYSPQGNRIVYSVCCPAPAFSSDIYTIASNGGGRQQLTATDRYEASPDWSVRVAR